MSETSDSLNDLPARLARLAPTSRLDRDRILFEAGASSVGRRRFAFPIAMLLLGVVVGGVGQWMWMEPRATPIVTPDTMVVVPAPPTTPIDPLSYLSLQRRYFDGDFDIAGHGDELPLPPSPGSLGEQRMKILIESH